VSNNLNTIWFNIYSAELEILDQFIDLYLIPIEHLDGNEEDDDSGGDDAIRDEEFSTFVDDDHLRARMFQDRKAKLSGLVDSEGFYEQSEYQLCLLELIPRFVITSAKIEYVYPKTYQLFVEKYPNGISCHTLYDSSMDSCDMLVPIGSFYL
jgi:hypothetical protein